MRRASPCQCTSSNRCVYFYLPEGKRDLCSLSAFIQYSGAGMQLERQCYSFNGRGGGAGPANRAAPDGMEPFGVGMGFVLRGGMTQRFCAPKRKTQICALRLIYYSITEGLVFSPIYKLFFQRLFSAAKESSIPALFCFAELKQKRIDGLITHATFRYQLANSRDSTIRSRSPSV